MNTKIIFKKEWFPIFVICFVALLLRIAYPLIPGAIYSITPPFDPLEGDPYYFDKITQGILNGEGYHEGNLYAYRPPLWTYFLAGLYYLTNMNYDSVHLALIILSITLVLLTYLIGNNIANKKVGLISTGLVAFYPQFIRYPSELLSENLYLPLFSLSILLLFVGFKRNNQLYYLFSGIITGIAALTRETAFYFPLLVLLWLILCRKKLIKFYIPYLIGFILVITPWTYRNYKVFNTFVPLTTVAGVGLYSGNNPDTVPGFSWKLPENVREFWNKPSPPGHPKGYYEILIYKESMKQGLDYILTHPKKTFKLWVKRFLLFWISPIQNLTSDISAANLFRIGWLIAYTFVLLTSMSGIYISRQEWKVLSIFYLFICFIMITNIIMHFESRYRLPAIPFMSFFSGIFLESIFKERQLKRYIIQL